MIPALAKLKNLKVLNLQKNPISSESFHKYFGVILDSNLEELILAGCLLKDEGLQSLLGYLTAGKLNKVRYMVLNANRITAASLQILK